MPGGSATAYRRWPAAEAGGAPYVRPLEYLVARDVCPAEGGDKHRTGAEAQSTPPPDAKGSGWVDEPPNYKTRLVVATLPSSRLLQGARCESRRGNDGTRALLPYSPTPLLPYSPTSSMILPICSPSSMRSCARQASDSGKIMSITGATFRTPRSGQTCASSAAAISPLNSML